MRVGERDLRARRAAPWPVRTAPSRDRAVPAPPGAVRRRRRTSAAAGADDRRGFAIRSRLVFASLRSASRCRIDASADLEGRFRLPDLLANLAILDAAMTWPWRTASPSLTLTVCSRPLTRGTTCTVAAPIRLPTTRTCSLTGARVAVANSTGIGGRRTGRRAAAAPAGRAGRAGIAASPAAVVEQEAAQGDDGDDDDHDCFAHGRRSSSFYAEVALPRADLHALEVDSARR